MYVMHLVYKVQVVYVQTVIALIASAVEGDWERDILLHSLVWKKKKRIKDFDWNEWRAYLHGLSYLKQFLELKSLLCTS